MIARAGMDTDLIGVDPEGYSDSTRAALDYLDEVLGETDCINLLRIQSERQRSAFFPSIREYSHLFGMNMERIPVSMELTNIRRRRCWI